MKKNKKILLWITGICGLFLALAAAIVIITPRVINKDSVRQSIENAVSKKLGGTLTYDRLDLVLFPRPDIQALNLKIEVPHAATASIERVRIHAQILPLLQGRFATSGVELDRPVLAVTLADKTTGSTKSTTGKAKQPVLTIDTVLNVASREMPGFSIAISEGKLSLVREKQTILSLADLETELAFIQEPAVEQGSSDSASDEHYHITGKAQAVISGIAALPGPISVSISRLDARPKSLVIANSRMRILDMDMMFSGTVTNLIPAAPRSDIAFRGSIGPRTAGWLGSLAGLPADTSIHTPLTITEARLRTTGTGTASSVSLAGSAAVKGGAVISFALQRKADLLAIETLRVKDRESDAVLKLAVSKKNFDLSFTGSLMSDTINRIFEHKGGIEFGWIKGDVRLRFPYDQPRQASAEGALEGERVVIPARLNKPFIIDHFSVKAEGRTVFLQPVVLALGKDILTLQGATSFADNGIVLDLDVVADRVNLQTLMDLGKQKPAKEDAAKEPASEKKLHVEGKLRCRATAVEFSPFTYNNVVMTISLMRDRTTLNLEHASVCGIPFDGMLQISDRDFTLSLSSQASGARLEETLPCILPEDYRVSGPYDFSGKFTGKGSGDELLRSLHGNFVFSTQNGRIQNDQIVKGVIAYLNSTSLRKDSQLSLLKEGVPYEAISLKGTLQDSTITLTEGIIKSSDLNITADGDIDLRDGTLALNILVAPFSKLDRVLGKIPIVKDIAGDALVVVPVRVEGPYKKPKVKPLAASGVSTNVTNLMKNIVMTPVKIVEPVIPGERDKAARTGKE